jgi:hypothetical protein
MGTNAHTAYVDDTTTFSAASMNSPLSQLDKWATYANKFPIVHCDGDISWASGSLAWDGIIRIVFNREDGKAIENTIAIGSVALSDNEFAYVTLNETDGTALSISKTTITTDTASNFLTLGIYVLAYRNTASNDIVLCGLPTKPHYIQEEGSSLARRPKLNFSGLSVTAADDSGNNATKVTFRNGIPVATVVSYGGTINLDLDAYNVADITLTGNPTINFTNGVDGQAIIIRLRQDGTGNRTVTWGSMVRFSTDAPQPTLSTAGDALDYLVFRSNEEESTAQYDFMASNKGF